MEILASMATWLRTPGDPNVSLMSESLLQQSISDNATQTWEAAKPSIEERANRVFTIAIGLIALSLSAILIRGINRWRVFGIYIGIETILSEKARRRFYLSESAINMYINVENQPNQTEDLIAEANAKRAACSEELARATMESTLLVRIVNKFDRWLAS